MKATNKVIYGTFGAYYLPKGELAIVMGDIPPQSDLQGTTDTHNNSLLGYGTHGYDMG